MNISQNDQKRGRPYVTPENSHIMSEEWENFDAERNDRSRMEEWREFFSSFNTNFRSSLSTTFRTSSRKRASLRSADRRNRGDQTYGDLLESKLSTSEAMIVDQKDRDAVRGHVRTSERRDSTNAVVNVLEEGKKFHTTSTDRVRKAYPHVSHKNKAIGSRKRTERSAHRSEVRKEKERKSSTDNTAKLEEREMRNDHGRRTKKGNKALATPKDRLEGRDGRGKGGTGEGGQAVTETATSDARMGDDGRSTLHGLGSERGTVIEGPLQVGAVIAKELVGVVRQVRTEVEKQALERGGRSFGFCFCRCLKGD